MIHQLCREPRYSSIGASGQQSEYFAGDGSFEQPQNLLVGPTVGQLTLDVAAGLRVGRHAHQRDAVQGVVGCPVAAAGQSVAGDFVKSEMPQAAYRWQGHGG
jgi:hypothetical protein